MLYYYYYYPLTVVNASDTISLDSYSFTVQTPINVPIILL